MPFQPLTGIQSSKPMSESLVGLADAITRHAATSIGGVAPGGSKLPAGTTAADRMMVSGRLSPARLAQDIGWSAYAGAETSTANATASLFMVSLRSIVVVIVVVLAVMLLRLARGQRLDRRQHAAIRRRHAAGRCPACIKRVSSAAASSHSSRRSLTMSLSALRTLPW